MRKKAPVRRRPAVAPPAAVVAAAAATAVAAVPADEAALDAELDETPDVHVPEAAPATMGLKRRSNTGPARRPRNGGA